MLQNKKICHAREQLNIARLCKQVSLLCPADPNNSPGTTLLGGFESSAWEVWNPLSKTLPRKCNFIWHKWPVNISNDRSAQNNLYVGSVNIFTSFYTEINLILSGLILCIFIPHLIKSMPHAFNSSVGLLFIHCFAWLSIKQPLLHLFLIMNCVIICVFE